MNDSFIRTSARTSVFHPELASNPNRHTGLSLVERLRGPIALGIVSLLAGACGGGGGDPSNLLVGGGGDWNKGVFEDAELFANRCENPRTGRSPITNLTYPDRNGSYRDENNFLRSWINDTYLWYREVPDLNPASYTDPQYYFSLLKTSAKTSSGQAKDQFHFTYNTDDYDALSQGGVTYGYGLNLFWPDNNMVITVAYTEPGSPAALANIPRGSVIQAVDGIVVADIQTASAYNTLIDALYPSTIGSAHTFTLQEPSSSSTRSVVMQSARVTIAPVQHVKTIETPTGVVGYLLFTDHTLTAEQALIDAMNQLSGVDDLIIDMRYNGGGYLDVASELGYMVAGESTTGKTFEQLQFNDKHPYVDPVTGAVLDPIPFHRTAVFQSNPQALPSLGLNRVFVLTGADTCSASESLMNGLRGIDVDVIQIGNTTCGKPYGFYPTPNCGTTYFSVQFRGVNAKNYGDFSNGFVPTSIDDGKARVRGCVVNDDFTHDLGDENEKRLAAALYFRANDACPGGGVGIDIQQKTTVAIGSSDGIVRKALPLQNKLHRAP